MAQSVIVVKDVTGQGRCALYKCTAWTVFC